MSLSNELYAWTRVGHNIDRHALVPWAMENNGTGKKNSTPVYVIRYSINKATKLSSLINLVFTNFL